QKKTDFRIASQRKFCLFGHKDTTIYNVPNRLQIFGRDVLILISYDTLQKIHSLFISEGVERHFLGGANFLFYYLVTVVQTHVLFKPAHEIELIYFAFPKPIRGIYSLVIAFD